MRRARERRRFTLIEMMLSVALTALIFAMIGGVLLSVIQARDGVEDMLLQDKGGYGVLNTLRRDLTGVYAYQLGSLAFRGEDKEQNGRPADELHFVTTADVAEADESGRKPRLVEVGYRMKEADEGDAIVLFRRASGLEGDPLTGGGAYTAIYQQVWSLDITYLDMEKNWVEKWEDPESLPLAVKVVLELLPDEVEKIAAEQEGREMRIPKYEMMVGIPATTTAPENQNTGAGEGQPAGDGQPAGEGQPAGGQPGG